VPTESQIQIRIGLHLGDVVHQDNDIYGDGVNIASRLEALADPAGICISQDLAHQIQNKVKEPIVKLGPSTLKNIHTPVDIYKIVL
jgi:class 3 adenylate cyclase